MAGPKGAKVAEPPARARGGQLRERRIEVNAEFAVLESFLTEHVTNVSHTGAFIRTRDPWPVGTRVRMRFTVLDGDLETLEGTAQVVRVSERPRGMGVEFLELPPSSRALIDRLLARRP